MLQVAQQVRQVQHIVNAKGKEVTAVPRVVCYHEALERSCHWVARFEGRGEGALEELLDGTLLDAMDLQEANLFSIRGSSLFLRGQVRGHLIRGVRERESMQIELLAVRPRESHEVLHF